MAGHTLVVCGIKAVIRLFFLPGFLFPIDKSLIAPHLLKGVCYKTYAGFDMLSIPVYASI